VPAAALAECVNNLSAESLLCAVLRHDALAPVPLPAVVAHNTINRLTQHTAEQGGLFFQTEAFPPKPIDYDVHLLTSLPPERVRDVFIRGLAGGYGRDASTGKGRLVVGDLDPSPWPGADRPNAALALGVFAPSGKDPSRGWWRCTVRLGKLGGPWVHGEAQGHVPFKHPLCMLQAGAILAPYSRPWLGRVVEGVHPTRTQVVTCAMAPVLPVRCAALEATEEPPPCPHTT